jgi:hypothetical protein
VSLGCIDWEIAKALILLLTDDIRNMVVSRTMVKGQKCPTPDRY